MALEGEKTYIHRAVEKLLKEALNRTSLLAEHCRGEIVLIYE